MSEKFNIGVLATELLRAGFDSKATLERVRSVFPDAKTKMASIYWYASQAGIQLNRGGKVVDSDAKARVMAELAAARGEVPAVAPEVKVVKGGGRR